MSAEKTAKEMEKEKNCVFCQVINGTKTDQEKYFEDENFIVMSDIKPHAKHHLLVITKEHIPSPKSLTSDQEDLVSKMVEVGTSVLTERGGDASDCRFGFHWPPLLSIYHLHLHVLSPVSEMSFLYKNVVFKPGILFVTPGYMIERLRKIPPKVLDSSAKVTRSATMGPGNSGALQNTSPRQRRLSDDQGYLYPAVAGEAVGGLVGAEGEVLGGQVHQTITAGEPENVEGQQQGSHTNDSDAVVAGLAAAVAETTLDTSTVAIASPESLSSGTANATSEQVATEAIDVADVVTELTESNDPTEDHSANEVKNEDAALLPSSPQPTGTHDTGAVEGAQVMAHLTEAATGEETGVGVAAAVQPNIIAAEERNGMDDGIGGGSHHDGSSHSAGPEDVSSGDTAATAHVDGSSGTASAHVDGSDGTATAHVDGGSGGTATAHADPPAVPDRATSGSDGAPEVSRVTSGEAASEMGSGGGSSQVVETGGGGGGDSGGGGSSGGGDSGGAGDAGGGGGGDTGGGRAE